MIRKKTSGLTRFKIVDINFVTLFHTYYVTSSTTVNTTKDVRLSVFIFDIPKREFGRITREIRNVHQNFASTKGPTLIKFTSSQRIKE
ncbi:hypothetical protein RIR_jg14902.t1 [Rhizophagus irregularis DAOM 181602=DAOM 197198]|uniref:Uncharacterized protein n=1 Tax=Rhizophagus irregularis (strain DAOM 181602 / DAOM 197198 / MUCL 43194) TaxID=747089 RepID=U9TI67_RHIID|nr:hypothetical protein RIR_jg14902.t1 [Rhizophagus irregularis DAOM 181602=DAOM 197198]